MGTYIRVMLNNLKATVKYIFSAATFLAALFTLLFTTAFGGTLYSYLSSNTRLFIPIFAFFLGMIITMILVVIIYYKVSPTKWIIKGYRWITAEYRYEIFEENSHHNYIVTIELEATRSGIDHFENRYFWSGKGSEGEIRVLSPGQRLLGAPIRINIYKYFYIHFGRELIKGERITTKTSQDLIDLEHEFKTFVGKLVAEPIDRLSLIVKLPNNLSPKNICYCIEDGITPLSKCLEKIPGVIDGNTREISWSIVNPVLSRLYVIRWDY